MRLTFIESVQRSWLIDLYSLLQPIMNFLILSAIGHLINSGQILLRSRIKNVMRQQNVTDQIEY